MDYVKQDKNDSLSINARGLAPSLTTTLVVSLLVLLHLSALMLISAPNSYYRQLVGLAVENRIVFLVGGTLFVILLAVPFYRLYSSLKITSDESSISISRGLLVFQKDDIKLNSIYHFKLSQTFIDRWFGVSSVELHAYGTSTKKISIRGISGTDTADLKAHIEIYTNRSAE